MATDQAASLREAFRDADDRPDGHAAGGRRHALVGRV